MPSMSICPLRTIAYYHYYCFILCTLQPAGMSSDDSSDIVALQTILLDKQNIIIYCETRDGHNLCTRHASVSRQYLLVVHSRTVENKNCSSVTKIFKSGTKEIRNCTQQEKPQAHCRVSSIIISYNCISLYTYSHIGRYTQSIQYT